MSMNDPADQRRELIEQKTMWEALQSSPAWLKLVIVLQSQADSLQTEVVFRPLSSMDGILQQEFQKGKLCGLLQVSNTVEGILNDLQIEIDSFKGDI